MTKIMLRKIVYYKIEAVLILCLLGHLGSKVHGVPLPVNNELNEAKERIHIGNNFCPIGDEYYFNNGVCYYFSKQSDKVNWETSKGNCLALGKRLHHNDVTYHASLLSIRSSLEQESLMVAIKSVKTKSTTFWTSGYFDRLGLWAWDDGKLFPMIHITFWNVYPRDSPSNCIVVDMVKSTLYNSWRSEACLIHHNYICQITPNPKKSSIYLLSLGKPTHASTLTTDMPFNAVDSFQDDPKTCFKTQAQNNPPYLFVDIQKEAFIDSVVIHSSDLGLEGSSKLEKIKIEVGSCMEKLMQCAFYTGPARSKEVVSLPCRVVGVVVKISKMLDMSHLELCEVSVFGHFIHSRFDIPKMISTHRYVQFKPSSNIDHLSLINDDVVSTEKPETCAKVKGNMANQMIIHVGQAALIVEVQIWLTQNPMYVLNKTLVSVGPSRDHLETCGEVVNRASSHDAIMIDCEKSGSIVMVEIASTDSYSICEIQIYGFYQTTPGKSILLSQNKATSVTFPSDVSPSRLGVDGDKRMSPHDVCHHQEAGSAHSVRFTVDLVQVAYVEHFKIWTPQVVNQLRGHMLLNEQEELGIPCFVTNGFTYNPTTQSVPVFACHMMGRFATLVTINKLTICELELFGHYPEIKQEFRVISDFKPVTFPLHSSAFFYGFTNPNTNKCTPLNQVGQHPQFLLNLVGSAFIHKIIISIDDSTHLEPFNFNVGDDSNALESCAYYSGPASGKISVMCNSQGHYVQMTAKSSAVSTICHIKVYGYFLAETTHSEWLILSRHKPITALSGLDTNIHQLVDGRKDTVPSIKTTAVSIDLSSPAYIYKVAIFKKMPASLEYVIKVGHTTSALQICAKMFASIDVVFCDTEGRYVHVVNTNTKSVEFGAAEISVLGNYVTSCENLIILSRGKDVVMDRESDSPPGTTVDGKYNSKPEFCVTSGERTHPFWTVHLLQNAFIESVKLQNHIGDDNIMTDLIVWTDDYRCAYFQGTAKPGEILTLGCNHMGKNVKIVRDEPHKTITICHVDVIGFYIKDKHGSLLSNGKPAFQSSVLDRQEASLAVDGIKSPEKMESCAAQVKDKTSFWFVDLGYNAVVYVVKIHTSETEASSIHKVAVQVAHVPPLRIQCAFYEGPAKSADIVKMECNKEGRYVYLVKNQYGNLVLSEVEVFGRIVDEVHKLGYNHLSKNKNTFQSSVVINRKPYLAVDGVRLNKESYCTSTQPGLRSFWYVDLGGLAYITNVAIMSIEQENLDLLTVTVGRMLMNRHECTSDGTSPEQTSVLIVCELWGRYVHVLKVVEEASSLVLCEVDVYGKFVEDKSILLSQKKPTRQSSLDGNRHSSLAVDGNYDQSIASCTGTVLMSNPFWYVDLLKQAHVDRVIIYTKDSVGHHLSSLKIEVGKILSQQKKCAFFVGPNRNAEILELSCDMKGRFVQIRLDGSNFLTLCEVEVFGEYLLENMELLSENKPTSQNIKYGGRPSKLAVDGNRNQNMKFCTGSAKTLYSPFWKVDLEFAAQVDAVVIYNRIDHGERLHNLTVAIHVSADYLVPCHFYDGPAKNGEILQFPCRGQGTAVSIHLNTPGFLTLCEVEVYGKFIREKVFSPSIMTQCVA